MTFSVTLRLKLTSKKLWCYNGTPFIEIPKTVSAFFSPYGLETLESIFRLRLFKQDGYKAENYGEHQK